jgi:hypothetical protein
MIISQLQKKNLANGTTMKTNSNTTVKPKYPPSLFAIFSTTAEKPIQKFF